MSWYQYPPYVSVAERKAKAMKKIAKLNKAGKKLSPVTIEGRTIAKTFWGKAWCDNLESYSDYENRLPRGRSYVRNGAVLDLQISKGEIKAQIMGSDHYHGHIKIAPLSPDAWQEIKTECSGKIESVIELLRGELSKSVMEVITRRDGGLFPKPAEIKLDCSCPDWAELCKHLAAVLYGVGARLDSQPELLFLLRGVDHTELIAQAASTAIADGKGDATLDSSLSEVFGIEIAEETPSATVPTPARKTPAPKIKSSKPAPAKKKKESVKKAKVIKEVPPPQSATRKRS